MLILTNTLTSRISVRALNLHIFTRTNVCTDKLVVIRIVLSTHKSACKYKHLTPVHICKKKKGVMYVKCAWIHIVWGGIMLILAPNEGMHSCEFYWGGTEDRHSREVSWNRGAYIDVFRSSGWIADFWGKAGGSSRLMILRMRDWFYTGLYGDVAG